MHAILRGSDWILSAERAVGAPEAIYGGLCLTCGQKSGLTDNDPKPVGVWAIDHTQTEGREHSQYLITTQQHWRVDPAPRPAPPAHTPPPPPRPRRPPSPLARLGRYAGPLLLTTLITGSAACGTLLGSAGWAG